MGKKSRPKLTFHEIIPQLTAQERGRRIEEFTHILAAVAQETGAMKGYGGCRYHTDSNMLEIFVETVDEGGG